MTTADLPVYIAAPFRAPSLEEIEVNCRRAAALGFYAASVYGATPIVPHAMGFLGVHGPLTAGDSNPEVRRRALDHACALVRLVGNAGGHLWVITNPDGSLSEGVAKELDAFRSCGVSWSQIVIVRAWSAWAQELLNVLPVTPATEPVRALCRL